MFGMFKKNTATHNKLAPQATRQASADFQASGAGVAPAVSNVDMSLVKAGKVRSVLAEGMTLKGDIILDNEGAKVDGHVQGNVHLNGNALLVIGERAVIEGNVMAPNIILAGNIHGNITARKAVILKTASVMGLLRYHQQTISNGANLVGGLTFLRKEEVAKLFPPPVSAQPPIEAVA